MSGGVALKGATIELKPLAGCRVTKIKETGAFEITSMETWDYSVIVIVIGKTSVADNVIIETNVPLQLDFILV